MAEADGEVFAGAGFGGGAKDGALRGLDDGVAAAEDGEGAELAEMEIERFKFAAGLPEAVLHGAEHAFVQGLSFVAAVGELETQVVGLQALVGVGEAFGARVEQGANRAAHGEFEFVDTLRAAGDGAVHDGGGAVDTAFMQGAGGHGQAIAQGLQHLGVLRGDDIEQAVFGADDELGGGRGRGRAEIGDEIGDGEIGFVADGGDDRHFGCANGAGDGLFVEGPQIFERAAAASEDDDVGPTAVR